MFRNIVNGLLAPETAPMSIRIEKNNVTLELFKRTDGDEIYYTGYPVASNGRTCRYGLRMDQTGHITGVPAVAFIEAGGDTRKLKRNGRELTPTFTELASAIMSTVLMIRLGDEAALEKGLDELAEAITRKLPPGVSAVRTGTGNISDAIDKAFVGESDMLALLGVEASLAKTMREYSLSYAINYAEFAADAVSNKYAELTDGDWDEESDLVADTARISESRKAVLIRGGKKLRRILRQAKA